MISDGPTRTHSDHEREDNARRKGAVKDRHGSLHGVLYGDRCLDYLGPSFSLSCPRFRVTMLSRPHASLALAG